ncbi:hormonally up-regulated neu tumor-associated kinase isoform X2 [Hippocampus zosterae]|uniref:hormonally up-regulated neu tumor-associated kinase isoform X2 n=1 Tax=Hippocampus zosterae TaxID=109293 RepID=UPI00223E0478|nr:hormonally up-regulated neu tumor-associated kinase isoform X2 [Hippocampus zosterae]
MPGAAVKGKVGAGPALLAAPCQDLLRSFPHTKRVGSYLVGKMINKGSFAKVMVGLHIATGEKVAIKVINKKRARQDPYVQKNMKREPRIHQMIRHPNVVLLLETLETENSFYMVLELCAGGDLMERICDRKRLPEKEVRRYARQILSAVAHLHQRGVVHRDLKIENFLLDEHNNIKIVDFGLSNTLLRSESLPPELLSTQCGSPAYAAPELLAHRKYGPKVDAWSVGVSVFAMLTGTLPFTVEPFDLQNLHHKMVAGDIAHMPGDISTGAVTFVLSLLEPDPDKRPSIRAAMEGGWINEGYAKRPLHTLSPNNSLKAFMERCGNVITPSRAMIRTRPLVAVRSQGLFWLRVEDLDPSVLAYMTDTLGYLTSEVTRTLVDNRPCAIMAAYHLLLAKIKRSRRRVMSDTVKEKKTASRHLKESKQVAERRCGRTRPQHPPRPQDRCHDEEEEGDKGAVSSSHPIFKPSPSPQATEDAAAAILNNRDTLILPDVLGSKHQVVYLPPPKTAIAHLCDSAPCHAASPAEPIEDYGASVPVQLARQHVGTAQSDGGGSPMEAVLRFDTPQKSVASPRMHLETTQRAAPKTLPRLPDQRLKNGRGGKVLWVPPSLLEPAGLQLSGSKTLTCPLQKNTLAPKGGKGTGTKRNSVAKFHSTLQRQMTELNLPLLPAALQRKTDRKLRNMDC